MSPSPTNGEMMPPKKNGQNPSTAEAEPAYSLPSFIASDEAVGKIKPVKSKSKKNAMITPITSNLEQSINATKILANKVPKSPVFSAFRSFSKLASLAPMTMARPFAAKQKL